MLAACGGGPPAPTAIPADIVRPQQSTPVYGQSAGQFALAAASLVITDAVAPTLAMPSPESAVVAANPTRRPLMLPMQQTPSALGIANAGAALLAAPGGRVLATLPPGATLTVTGKSADQRYLAAYTGEGVAGWVAAGQLLLFGGDDLIVVEAAVGPGPIATLLAEAMKPVVLPASTPAPADTVVITTTTGNLSGTVTSEGRLNLRNAPAVDAAIVAKLNNGDRIQIISASADGQWLQVQLTSGTEGWVSAAYVRVGE
ncbi:MAG: SH3 domain-containing protein [Chloroflexota bacterium]|nr:SH3 domain-containing protein [Chloroflexota bacterium]